MTSNEIEKLAEKAVELAFMKMNDEGLSDEQLMTYIEKCMKDRLYYLTNSHKTHFS